jgi:hypothetical protein
MAFMCQYSRQQFEVGEVFFVRQARTAPRTVFFDLFFLLQFRSSVLLANLCAWGCKHNHTFSQRNISSRVAPTVGREEDRSASNTRTFSFFTNNNFKFFEREI